MLLVPAVPFSRTAREMGDGNEKATESASADRVCFSFSLVHRFTDLLPCDRFAQHPRVGFAFPRALQCTRKIAVDYLMTSYLHSLLRHALRSMS